MPAPSLRVVRRPKRRALTAASQQITDPNRVFRTTVGSVASVADWQDEAWDLFDLVGEFRYYVGWRAASCSRVRLIASDVDPQTGLPTGQTENARVNQIITSMAGGVPGQSQMIKRLTECLTVPGEAWQCIIFDPLQGERWITVTKEEMHRNGRGVEIDLPEGGRHELAMPRDSLIRIWNPRPRKANEPDSPVRACLDPLREIVRTTKTISNASKSRLIGNGVVFVPQEMSLPPVNAPGLSPIQFGPGTPAVQQLQELLWQVANTAYDDEDSMAALIPMFATVPAEFVDKVQHLKFDNTVTDIAIKVRNDAISRLAMGLDVSPERLLGLGNQSNHWSAWQIADEDVQLHIAPVMETICQTLNETILRVVFEREGIDPDRFMVWYDSSQLTIDPDKTDNAEKAFLNGTITAEAYRDYLGLANDDAYDYTTIEGWQQWAQDHVSAKPELMGTLAPLLGPIAEVYPELSVNFIPEIEPAPEPEDSGESEPDTEGEPPPVEAVAASAGQLNDAQLAVIDLLTLRALELVGKRRRRPTDHARLRDVPMHQTHRYMQPVSDTEIPKLMAGWDGAIEDEVLARLNLNRDDVAAAVRRAVRRELTRPVVDG
jgi:hypothetical protein